MDSTDIAALRRENDELRAVAARQKEELARLNNELRRANVLKSQFLATISHELRTPLTSIIGFGTMLLRGRPGEALTERQRDNAERILASARQLAMLINDVLDLSRIEAGRLDIFHREVDLGALLQDLCAEMEKQAAAKGLTLRVEVAAGLDRVVTDGDRLRQILINLIANAIKFTDRGGVTVHAERGWESFIVSVQDTGKGIAPAQQQHIFDEFYQIDQSSTRSINGAGVGLTVAQRLVSLMSGRLTLHSVPGEGSTFTLVLPAGSDDHTVTGTRPADDRARRKGAARVLVIDDDPQIIVLVERTLEGSRFEVTGALSADEGLRKAHSLRPDVILLDVMMAETDGWRVLHRVKSDPLVEGIPVVMHTIVDDKALGFSLGATDYLVKPVEHDQLLAALQRLTLPDTGPILVVDDDDNVRTLLSEAMAAEGFAVQVAASGEEALRLAGRQLPRLIVLDLLMPGVDGFEVLRQLRARPHTRNVPVVVVTAKTLSRTESQALRRDASLVIAKNGVPLDDLLGEILGAMRAT